MHNAQPEAANLLWVTKKRSTNPQLKAFGRRLEELRNKVSREAISLRLEKLGVPLGGSTLAQYEKGNVWAPDPGVLWGLAQIYHVQLQELILLLRENRRHPEADVIHVSDIQHREETGLANQLTSERERSQATLRVVEKVAHELFELLDEDVTRRGEAAARPPRIIQRRRRPR
jgi:transcriptional regulator with XRE-family HTH domain